MEFSYNHFDNGDAHLPPGFRFHPTDEELITYYLLKKVLDSNFSGRAIAEVDLNKCEPWELPRKSLPWSLLNPFQSHPFTQKQEAEMYGND